MVLITSYNYSYCGESKPTSLSNGGLTLYKMCILQREIHPSTGNGPLPCLMAGNHPSYGYSQNNQTKKDGTPVMRHVGWLMLPHPAKVITIKSVNLVTSYKPILAVWLAGAPLLSFLSCPIHRYPEKNRVEVACLHFCEAPAKLNLGGAHVFFVWPTVQEGPHRCEAGIWSQHCWGAKPKLTTAQVGTAKWGLCFLYLSGWWFGTFFIFPYIYWEMSSQLTFRFFREVAQPPTSYDYRISRGFSTSDRFFRGFTMIYHVFSDTVGGTWVMKQALSGSWSFQLAPAKHIGSPYQRQIWVSCLPTCRYFEPERHLLVVAFHPKWKNQPHIETVPLWTSFSTGILNMWKLRHLQWGPPSYKLVCKPNKVGTPSCKLVYNLIQLYYTVLRYTP